MGVGGGEGDRQDLGVAVQACTREARNKGHISLFYDRNWSPGEQLRGRGRVRLVSQGKPGQPGLDSSEAVFCTPLGTSLFLLSAEAWGHFRESSALKELQENQAPHDPGKEGGARHVYVAGGWGVGMRGLRRCP